MQPNKWSAAATSGLLLALVTIVYTLIQTVFELPTAVTLILWAGKLFVTLWLLLSFIKDYSQQFDFFTYKNGLYFGFLTSFLSSVICAGYMFLHYSVLFPDSIAEQMEAAMIMLSSDPEAVENLLMLEAKLPQIMFAASIVYYSLFGFIASLIIANYTKKGDFFSDTPSV